MKKVTVAALALLCLGVAVQAKPITATFTGEGAGTLNGRAFGKSKFTILVKGDTNQRNEPSTNLFAIPSASASITIQGLSTYNFLSDTRMFVNNNTKAVGFSRDKTSGLDLYDIFNVSFVPNWDMLTSIGPISSSKGQLMQWSNDIRTTGGILAFSDSYNISATFIATVVPEPTTIVALCGGLLSLVGLRRRLV